MPGRPPRYVSTEAFVSQQKHPNGGVRERFAFNLRRARHATGISQEELGERSDLHRTEISLLERAGREPRLGTIVRLAGALGVTPGALGVTPGALCVGMTWNEDGRRFEFPPD